MIDGTRERVVMDQIMGALKTVTDRMSAEADDNAQSENDNEFYDPHASFSDNRSASTLKTKKKFKELSSNQNKSKDKQK